MKERPTSENRRALPKFFATTAASLLLGGVLGFAIGLSRAFGLDLSALTGGLSAALESATPWGIPVSSVLTLGACFLLYRSARKAFAVWSGGDEDAAAESAELLLSWILLLSAVQLLLNLFFMASLCVYGLKDGALPVIGLFLVSCGLVAFAQQKAVDLTRRMNPEKRGSVYDSKFQAKWLDSCDESERRQIGEASRQAYWMTSKLCLGLWVALVLLSLVVSISLLPFFVLLLVWGTMQVTYALACIRMSRSAQ